jgi:hypothetical protein
MDAVRCLQTVGKARTEVVRWIRGDKPPARIPFQSLCEDLGLEAARLGRRLLLPVIPGGHPQRRIRVMANSGRMRIVTTASRPPLPAPEAPVDPVSAALVSAWPDVA